MYITFISYILLIFFIVIQNKQRNKKVYIISLFTNLIKNAWFYILLIKHSDVYPSKVPRGIALLNILRLYTACLLVNVNERMRIREYRE